jgi:hypothetical protein
VNNCKGLTECAAGEEPGGQDSGKSEGRDFGGIEGLKVKTLGGLKT